MAVCETVRLFVRVCVCGIKKRMSEFKRQLRSDCRLLSCSEYIYGLALHSEDDEVF